MTGSNAKSSVALRLPAKLNSASAPELQASIKRRLGKDLTLDAADVSQIGALCLQILICARSAWQQAGHTFEVKNLPADIRDMTVVFGVAPSEIGLSEV